MPPRIARVFYVLIAVVAIASSARAQLPTAPPLRTPPAFAAAGPVAARGAFVWLHGAYDSSLPPPAEPPIIRRFAASGWDIWRFDRTTGHDPVGLGGDQLILGLQGLRAGGYKRIIVGGHSRGAFIALNALRVPGLADGYLLASPAAHGPRTDRRAQAMADFNALLNAAVPAPGGRIASLQFADDPLDPDPSQRRAAMEAMAKRTGLRLLSIFAPREPRGHLGIYDGDFDRLFGAELSGFLTPP